MWLASLFVVFLRGGGGSLLDHHAVRQVLGVVLEELRRGPGAVGELQLLQVLQLDQPREPCGGQQGAAWGQQHKAWLSPINLLGHAGLKHRWPLSFWKLHLMYIQDTKAPDPP